MDYGIVYGAETTVSVFPARYGDASDETFANGDGGGLSAIDNAQFGEEIGDVGLDCA